MINPWWKPIIDWDIFKTPCTFRSNFILTKTLSRRRRLTQKKRRSESLIEPPSWTFLFDCCIYSIQFNGPIWIISNQTQPINFHILLSLSKIFFTPSLLSRERKQETPLSNQRDSGSDLRSLTTASNHRHHRRRRRW